MAWLSELKSGKVQSKKPSVSVGFASDAAKIATPKTSTRLLPPHQYTIVENRRRSMMRRMSTIKCSATCKSHWIGPQTSRPQILTESSAMLFLSRLKSKNTTSCNLDPPNLLTLRWAISRACRQCKNLASQYYPPIWLYRLLVEEKKILWLKVNSSKYFYIAIWVLCRWHRVSSRRYQTTIEE